MQEWYSQHSFMSQALCVYLTQIFAGNLQICWFHRIRKSMDVVMHLRACMCWNVFHLVEFVEYGKRMYAVWLFFIYFYRGISLTCIWGIPGSNSDWRSAILTQVSLCNSSEYIIIPWNKPHLHLPVSFLIHRPWLPCHFSFDGT